MKTDLGKAAWYIKRHWDGMENRDTKPIPAQKNTDYGLKEVCEAWGITDDTLFFVMKNLYSLVVPNENDDSTYASSLELAYVFLNKYIRQFMKFWKPKPNDVYYVPDLYSLSMYARRKWIKQPWDEAAYAKGIIFKTCEEARDMCIKMTEFARRERNK